MNISRTKNREEGVILLTVIMLSIVLSIVAIGIMSVNVSQVKTGQSVVDSIKAEQLALGAFYMCHQAMSEGSNCPTSYPSPELNKKIFNVDVKPNASATSTPNDTTQYDITIEY